MKKPEIAKQWARESGVSEAEAADRLDRVVRQILLRLREEREVPLPGVGRFLLGPGGKVLFEGERGGRRG
jgi:nucleoid DNA-binding protein